jgi:hypothetical protein
LSHFVNDSRYKGVAEEGKYREDTVGSQGAFEGDIRGQAGIQGQPRIQAQAEVDIQQGGSLLGDIQVVQGSSWLPDSLGHLQDKPLEALQEEDIRGSLAGDRLQGSPEEA